MSPRNKQDLILNLIFEDEVTISEAKSRIETALSDARIKFNLGISHYKIKDYHKSMRSQRRVWDRQHNEKKTRNRR